MTDKTNNAANGDLAGRFALVTGAGNGIGHGIALVLASHGAEVVCLDLKADAVEAVADEIRASGGKAHAVTHDVSDWDAAPAVFEKARELGGRTIDVLVNNAGVYFSKPFEQVTHQDHDWLYGVNVTGVFAMCRAALTPMRANRFGKIVNIASISGRDPFAQSASYGSSKSAVIGMTKSLAKEFAPDNINVNAVCPGFIRTSMQVEQCEKLSAKTGRPAEEIWNERVAKVPLQRSQEPSDLGEAVAFLASERARNITGQGLSVCGGLQMVG